MLRPKRGSSVIFQKAADFVKKSGAFNYIGLSILNRHKATFFAAFYNGFHNRKHMQCPLFISNIRPPNSTSTNGNKQTHIGNDGKADYARHNTDPGLQLEYAANFLRYEGVSVSEAAFRSGFYDPLYFFRIFHRYMGTTLSRWRNQ